MQILPALMSATAVYFGLPVLALTASEPAPKGADTALLALGARFDAIHAAFIPAYAREKALEPAYEARNAEIGQRLRAKEITADEAMRLLDQAANETGAGDAAAEVNRIVEDLEPVADQIRAMRAHTLAGMALKARVAAWARGYCGGIDPEEYPDLHVSSLLRDLIAAVPTSPAIDLPEPHPAGADAELIAMCSMFTTTDEASDVCWNALDAAIEAGDEEKAETLDRQHGVLCGTYCRLLERITAVQPKTVPGFVAVAQLSKRLRVQHQVPAPRFNSDALALHLVESLAALEGSR